MAKRKGGFKVKGVSEKKEHKRSRKSHKKGGRKRSHKK
jgi:hypothetical protein